MMNHYFVKSISSFTSHSRNLHKNISIPKGQMLLTYHLRVLLLIYQQFLSTKTKIPSSRIHQILYTDRPRISFYIKAVTVSLSSCIVMNIYLMIFHTNGICPPSSILYPTFFHDHELMISSYAYCHADVQQITGPREHKNVNAPQRIIRRSVCHLFMEALILRIFTK